MGPTAGAVARLLLCSAALLLLSACAGNRVPAHPKLDRVWRSYTKLPAQRALAVAGDPRRAWVSAAVGGADTQEGADERALAECRVRRRARRMQSPCRVYARGDAIVWEDR